MPMLDSSRATQFKWGKSLMTRKRDVRSAITLPIMAMLLMLSGLHAPGAHAQTCPFDDGNSSLEVEGLILTRYALGITGAPLVASTNINAVDAPTVEAAINCQSCGLNITGNPTMTVADATIISRKLAGFSGAALTDNLALGSGTRNTPAAVQSFLLSGCGATGGTVTSITAGTGLTGGTITTSGTIAVDPAVVQLRVSSTCVVGTFITAVAANGTVTCAAPPAGNSGTVTSVATGAGLTGGPISTTGTVSIAGGGVTAAMLAPNLSLGGTTTGTFSGPLTGNVIGNITGNVTGSAASFSSALAGDVTGTQGATVIAAPTVTGKVLTGFVSGAGTVSASDSILTAVNKLNGNVALKAPLASPQFSGTVGIGTAGTGSPLTVAGVIESTSGGVKFPNGTTQTAAAVSVGAAQFIESSSLLNSSVPPGVTFTFSMQVINSIPGLFASAGSGGTVFTLSSAGTYVLDYEMSLNSAASIAVYKGSNVASLVIDYNTTAGSTTATTWIHGRAFVVVSGAPVVVGISPVINTAGVAKAGNAPFYIARLSFLKIS